MQCTSQSLGFCLPGYQLLATRLRELAVRSFLFVIPLERVVPRMLLHCIFITTNAS